MGTRRGAPAGRCGRVSEPLGRSGLGSGCFDRTLSSHSVDVNLAQARYIGSFIVSVGAGSLCRSHGGFTVSVPTGDATTQSVNLAWSSNSGE